MGRIVNIVFCLLERVQGVYKQTLINLVMKPFKNWKDAIEVFNSHTNCEYHKTCILKETCAKQILDRSYRYPNRFWNKT